MSGCGDPLQEKNGRSFVCLAICGGKERRYHSSSEEDSEGRESNFGSGISIIYI